MSVILVSSDLFIGSRVRASAENAGQELHVVVDEVGLTKQLNSETSLVLVDLSTPGSIQSIVETTREASAARVIAYGPHVQTGRLESAATAGCDAVLTKGQFDQTLPSLLQSCSGEN